MTSDLVLDLREYNDYLVSQTCKHIIRTQFSNCYNIVYRVLWKRNGSSDSPQGKVGDGETMVQEMNLNEILKDDSWGVVGQDKGTTTT